ncbi:MAG: arginine repressor [Clostridia bacterium]|nr:arginine repressor [Clostridia bacterium]
MNKRKRQEIILEIISKTEADTQEELVAILESQGLKVTQATVSRDIKEMGLVKVSGKDKKYRYQKPMTEESDDVNALLKHFGSAVLSVTPAMNGIVVRTLSGNANAVGVIVDGRKIEGVIGTIAGDDTLLVITPDVETAKYVAERIGELFKL